jgi:hypothetical protein
MDNLAVSEVEIKYSINLTDNMLSKTQSYGTLIQTMPPAMALRICRMSNDTEAEGAIIEASPVYKAFLAQLQSKSQTNTDNNSQE